MLLIVLALGGALAVAAAVARPLVVRRRVLVNLTDGKALDGVLWRRGPRLLVLKGASLLQPGVDPVPLDGEVVVERSRVDFVQALARRRP